MGSERRTSDVSNSSMLGISIYELKLDYDNRSKSFDAYRKKISGNFGKCYKYANRKIPGISQELCKGRGFFAKLADKLYMSYKLLGRERSVPVVSEEQTADDVALARKVETAVEANAANNFNSQDVPHLFVADKSKISESSMPSDNVSNELNGRAEVNDIRR